MGRSVSSQSCSMSFPMLDLVWEPSLGVTNMTTHWLARGKGCADCLALSRCVLSPMYDGECTPEPTSFPKKAYARKNETIFLEGAVVPGWVILCAGMAKALVRTEDGKQLLLRYISPGQILHSSPQGTFSHSAVAIHDSLVGTLTGEQVTVLGHRHPGLLLEANRQIALEQSRLERRLATLAYANVSRRLTRVLLELGEEYGVGQPHALLIRLPLTLADISNMIGASRQATCTALRRLARRELIKVNWPSLYVLDARRLRDVR